MSSVFRGIISSFVLVAVLCLNCGFQEATLIELGSGPVTIDGVTVEARVMSQHESAQTLGRALHRWEIVPIQVKIQNDTKEAYSLSSEGVDLYHASSSEVAMSVSRSSIPRSIALKIAGFLFWPMMLPSAIDSILTFKSHLQMRSDYYARSIKEEGEEILPYSSVERILFVPKEKWSEKFMLKLHKIDSRKTLPFSVNLGNS